MSNIARLHVLVIHTPLQALSATTLIKQYLSNSPSDEKVLLFCEGDVFDRFIDPNLNADILRGQVTRPTAHENWKSIADSIKCNRELLQNYIHGLQPQKVSLYLSELIWLFNKVIYHDICKHFRHEHDFYLFDEGLHHYVNDHTFTEDPNIVTVKKIGWLALQGIFIKPMFLKSVFQKKVLKGIYCYQPCAIREKFNKEGIEVLSLEPSVQSNFFKEVTSHFSFGEGKGTLFFLSQPFSRLVGFDVVKDVMLDFKKHYASLGVSKFYVKMHYADEQSWIDFLINELGFEPFPSDKDMPIEVYAQGLNFEYIVSISTSALANLNVFGYPNSVESFGLHRVAVTPKFKAIHDRLAPVFKEMQIKVTD